MSEAPFDAMPRHRMLAGLAVAMMAAGLALGSAPSSAAPVDEQYTGFTYITKRPDVTVEEMIDRYENGHAPGAMKSAMRFFPRYSRNYVGRVTGEEPFFQCIMESSPTSDFPVDFACGKTMDPNWSMVLSGEVGQRLLHGPGWAREAGPIRKIGYMMHSDLPEGPDRENAVEAYGTLLAKRLASHSRRIILYHQKAVRHTYACTPAPRPADAILMVWPLDGFALPDRLPPGAKRVRVGSILELVSYASDVPQPRP